MYVTLCLVAGVLTLLNPGIAHADVTCPILQKLLSGQHLYYTLHVHKPYQKKQEAGEHTSLKVECQVSERIGMIDNLRE